MDDVVPIPDLLQTRPDRRVAGHRPIGQTKGEGSLANFDFASQSAPDCPQFQGVRVFPDFLSPPEATTLLREIDRSDFVKAQSGKRKQHYGPKINFNKKKMNSQNFEGLPAYAAELEDRLRNLARSERIENRADRVRFESSLESFEATDVFVLRYLERDESNLDFHLDDTFAYGELILDLSLESDSVLTFLRTRLEAGSKATECVRVPLPARSLAAVYGPARFEWEHAILSYDIADRRTSVTLRTLHENLLRTEDGQRVVELARRSRKSQERTFAAEQSDLHAGSESSSRIAFSTVDARIAVSSSEIT